MVEQAWHERVLRGDSRRFLVLALAVFAAMLLHLNGHGSAERTLLIAPEAGIAIGGLLVGGRRLWPAIWIAATVAQWIAVPGQPLPYCIVIGLGEAISALIGAEVTVRLGRKPGLRRLIPLFGGGLAAALLDSTNEWVIGLVSGVPVAGEADGSWLNGFACEALGIAAAMPLILVWSKKPRETWTRARVFHLLAMAGVTAAIASQIAFGDHTSTIAWMVFPVMVWSALSFQLYGATVSVFLFAVLTTAGTALGHGPFEVGDDAQIVTYGQIALGAIMATMYTLAIAVDSRERDTRVRRAEALARERETRLLLFLDNAPSAIAVFDPGMRYIGASRRYYRDYRLDPEVSLIGLCHYDVFPDIPGRWRDLHQRTLAGEELSCDEDSFVRANGHIDYVRWSMRPWRDEKGAIGGMMLFTEVITAAVEARRRNEAAEARYRAVFEQAAVGVSRHGLDGRYLEVNDRECEILGRTREELLGRSFATFTHPDDLAPQLESARAMLAGARRTSSTEKRIFKGDGSIAWIMVSAGLVRNSSGLPDHFVSVVEDVTDRRRTERALRESEERLRLAQEAAGVGVWEMDLKRRVAIHSPVSQRLNGLPEGDGVYPFEALEALFGEALTHEVRANVASAAEGATYDSTYRAQHPDGSLRWVHSIGRFTPGEDGGPGRVLGVSIDVTAFHEAQADLIAAHDKLMRVSRLSAMGAMASTLAHELNQPLAAATNYAQACRQMLKMRGNADDAPLINMLEAAAGQALRAGEIIRKMRAFTITGEITSSEEDIGRMIETVRVAKRERIQKAGVTIDVRIDPDVGPVLADRIQIEQVIGNLLRNAIEAMANSDERRIDIHVSRRNDDMLMRIADTGPGIPAEARARLFEPFHSSKGNGMGLGLSICRTIVEAHGGKLWAESPDGGGAALNLTLPLAEIGMQTHAE